MNTRDWVVDRVKRRATALLHRTPQGEALLMRLYLTAEEQSELPLLFTRSYTIARKARVIVSW